MSTASKSIVTLRISGDTLIPAEITQLLGAPPTGAETKGEEIVGRQTGKRRVAKTGMWRFSVADREPEEMDAQVRELFALLTSDLTVWRGLAERSKIDLFCGYFMADTNDGFGLSPQSLLLLAERGIEIQFDLNAPSPGEFNERT